MRSGVRWCEGGALFVGPWLGEGGWLCRAWRHAPGGARSRYLDTGRLRAFDFNLFVLAFMMRLLIIVRLLARRRTAAVSVKKVPLALLAVVPREGVAGTFFFQT